MIDDNPAADLSAIKVTDDDFEVNPFTEKEYKVILKAIPACDDISALNRARVAALMQLQRWSGLSLVDAVCLSRAELVKAGTRYSIDTSRRKTGSKISNVIPAWLGQLLLKLKNSNASYFVWSGESSTKSATGVYDKLYRRSFDKRELLMAARTDFVTCLLSPCWRKA
jgi:hypothetical protein